MKNTKIDWADHSWNPVTGCTKVSPGCQNCYAEAIAEKYRGQKAFPIGFDIQLRPKKLNQPLSWKQPARIFVNSMSDLFHRNIPETYLEMIWKTMLRADWHIFQVLTKRPHRMQQMVERLDLELAPHIWLGVSAENQDMADSRIPPLLATAEPYGADVTAFVSAEPLLGQVDLLPYIYNSPVNRIDWVIAGGESGPGRRSMKFQWAEFLRDQCVESKTPFFFKQGNSFRPGQDRILDGRTWEQYPD